MFREEVVELLKITALSKEEILKLLEVPPEEKLGDFAFPCFALAKQLKKSPVVIASDFAKCMKRKGAVSKIESNGPYINFFIDKNKLAEAVLKQVLECGSLYGSGKAKDEKIMVEYPAPNTNKPLHLGHARNMLLGSSICNILGFAGYKAIPVDLVNDRGVHICKSMLAYKKWGHNKDPDKKPDHFVGDFYVMYSKEAETNPALEEEVQKMLLKWENNDLETIKVWSKMRKWSLDGMKSTYDSMGVHHKKTYYESELYTFGKDIILQGLKDGVFVKDENGAVVADLEKFGLGKKVLLRADGTSIYITQDIYLAKLKFDDFKMDRSVYVVGNEQLHHFKVLFKILQLLKMPFAEYCHHLSYGMISLPSGRMKSREGTVVDCDDLIVEMKRVAGVEIKKRHEKISQEELEKRSRIIGMGALKFFILKYDPQKDFVYNPEESISFDGETGPYVQYAHARICSIFRQVNEWEPNAENLEYSHEKEFSLIKLLADYPNVVHTASEKYDPSHLARYLLVLAQTFSSFYQECPVLKEKKKVKNSRLALIHATRVVLQSGLLLLGIDAPDEM